MINRYSLTSGSRTLCLLAVILGAPLSISATPALAEPKQHSVFTPESVVQRAQANADRFAWAKSIRQDVIKAAQPWMKYTDQELWDMVFGPTISRSWMVWSNGFCPKCKKSVSMYNWAIQPFSRAWKVQCPNCKQIFPTNDFEKFYKSGMDVHGVFDPKLADRSLLYNVEHPDPHDPLHTFGVDDGEGYVEGANRWRFIGAYLVRGVWKLQIFAGINNLSDAYVATADPAYAHKAGVLIDRLADLHPSYDGSQLYVYEKTGPNHGLTHGYLSPWHDAAVEIRQVALAYDGIFDAIKRDASLVQFLHEQAQRHKLDNPKATFADVQKNVEHHMFGDVLANRKKIESNYPSTDLTLITIKTVLGWPENKAEVLADLNPVIDKATAVDGLSGEKGVTVYAATSSQMLAELLGYYQRADKSFLSEMLKLHPKLHDTYRFHIDTRIMNVYYPNVGDSGRLGFRSGGVYAGAGLSTNPGVKPSNYTFLWDLYHATHDPAFLQVMYAENKHQVNGLPYDLLVEDPTAIQKEVDAAVKERGPDPVVGSIDKKEWCLAIMRTGDADHARAISMAYDAFGEHAHGNGMNLDFYTHGYDMMPDFGYPQVQYGGWGSPKQLWYSATAAHNTVTVDGKNQERARGKTTLWADGESIQALRVTCPEMLKGGKQYERTTAMIDIAGGDSYLFDVFRVVGGQRHTFFLHSNFSTLSTPELSPSPIPNPDFGPNAQMRNFAIDQNPSSRWLADWKIDDRLCKYLPAGTDLHMRYVPLGGQKVAAGTCEAWVVAASSFEDLDTWLQRLFIERTSPDEAPLASTFAGTIEAYVGKPKLAETKRLAITSEAGQAFAENTVGALVNLSDGRRDIILAADVENPQNRKPSAPADAMCAADERICVRGEFAVVRQDAHHQTTRVILVNGTELKSKDVVLRLVHPIDLIELQIEGGQATLLRGKPDAVAELLVNGKSVQPKLSTK
jgi:hypothetical protein